MKTDIRDLDRPVLSPQIALLTTLVLEEHGVGVDHLFDRLDFEHSKLTAKDSLLTFNEMFALIDAALQLSSIPWLGLEVGRAETISSWGVLGYAIMSSATEREAMQIGARYFQAGPSFVDFESAIKGDRQRIQMNPIYPVERLLPFCIEESITGICGVSSEYMSEPMPPLEIEFSFSEPYYSAKYDEYFGCPVLFEQEKNVLWTRAPTDAPLRTADPISADTCLRLVEQLVEKHQEEDDFVHTLRRLLLKTPGNLPGMEEVANQLGMTSRTLRRKLDDMDSSFKSIQADVRMNLAIEYLESSDLNIDQIAPLLGYTETTNFRRAFKQWTGHPPSYFRD